jgi:hypothetical protein
MARIDTANIERWYARYAQKKLAGRRIRQQDIDPLLEDLTHQTVEVIGKSFEGRPIRSVVYGQGELRILIWSQMHGNESTGTKAIFDLLQFFQCPGDMEFLKDEIQKKCRILLLPILNPDGAEQYTRVNKQNIDLNRDAVQLKAPESRILREQLKTFAPKYCFNLHDQRTIFSVGAQKEPATISFLAPSEEVNRTVTEGRKETMRLIVAMNQLLSQFIPGRIGRYTDEFYPAATGDNFQKEGYHTALIESGHTVDDYQREITRKYTFYALIQGIVSIAGGLDEIPFEKYFEIPDNDKCYLDIIYKNVKFQGTAIDIGILFIEKLQGEKVIFEPLVEKTGDLSAFNANFIIEKKGLNFENYEDVYENIKNNVHIY